MKFELGVSRDSLFTVDIATPDNYPLEEIASVINSAYSKVEYLQGDRISIPDLESIVSDKQKRLYLCISKTKSVIGTIFLDFTEKDQAELGLFSILPTDQGKNIGALFMAHVEQEVCKQVKKIHFNVIPLFQEKLISFYERLGYRPTGKKIEFLVEQKVRYIKAKYHNDVYFSTYEKALE